MDIFKINQINKATSKGVSGIYMNRGICISRSPALCLARGPGPKFVFIGPGPQFEFTGPDPKFVFTGPGTKFVFTGPSTKFAFTSPGPK